MTRPIQEHVDSRGVQLAVDREAGVIRGVKILGLTSKNGREYRPEALRRAVGLYEGKSVNVDHIDADGRRSYADRIGRLSGVQVREDGLYGDLHFNPKHSLAEQLIWDATNNQQAVGLSHDASGRTSRKGGKTIVEEIESVRSVDLVAEPATTRGLYESHDPKEEQEARMSTDLKEATVDQLRRERADLVESIKRDLAESEEAKARVAELKQLREEVAALKAEKAMFERREKVNEELAAAGFDTTDRTAVSDLFLDSLLREEDATKRQAIIDDRRSLLANLPKPNGNGTPKSRSRVAESAAGAYGDMPVEKRITSWTE